MPQLGIEPGSQGPKSDSLPRRCKSRLIQRGCTSVDKLHSTTYTSSIFRLVIESQRTFILDTDVLPAHPMGYLHWAPIVTGEKMLITFASAGNQTQANGSEIRHSTTSL